MTGIRLTQYARGGGCGCKIPPGELEAVLAGLPGREDEGGRVLLADAQTPGGLLVAGEVPGAPVIGELTAARDAVLIVR
ncbi:hypothetical protein [Nonomuraea monospora]